MNVKVIYISILPKRSNNASYCIHGQELIEMKHQMDTNIHTFQCPLTHLCQYQQYFLAFVSVGLGMQASNMTTTASCGTLLLACKS